jgi:hypothetical protein
MEKFLYTQASGQPLLKSEYVGSVILLVSSLAVPLGITHPHPVNLGVHRSVGSSLLCTPPRDCRRAATMPIPAARGHGRCWTPWRRPRRLPREHAHDV